MESDEESPSVFGEHSVEDGSFLFTGDAFSVVLVPGGRIDGAITIATDVRGRLTDRSVGEGRGLSRGGKIAGSYDKVKKKWYVEMALPSTGFGVKPELVGILGANFVRHYKPDAVYVGTVVGQLRRVSWVRLRSSGVGCGCALDAGLLILQ